MLQKALMVQARVVKALILRETKTRFGDHKLGYLWALLEPILFITIFVGLYALMGRTSVSGMPRAQFMLTGFIPFFFFRKTMQQTISAIDSNRGLLTFPQVSLFDVILARALLEIATMTVVFFLLILGYEAVGLRIDVQDPLKVMAVLGLLGMTGLGFGAAFAMLKPLFPSVKQMVDVVLGRPLFLSSGLFFTAEMLPASARQILLYNPILHMIEMLRSAFFVQFDSRYADPDYAIAFAVIVLCLGLLIQRALNRRVLKLRT
jgi:capsular polysaccharide transport system permease protein